MFGETRPGILIVVIALIFILFFIMRLTGASNTPAIYITPSPQVVVTAQP